jgi:nucleoside 2-deoxyribosyltransferase
MEKYTEDEKGSIHDCVKITKSQDCLTGAHKTKLYLVGPMRGIPLFNFPAFDSAAYRFREMGYDVTSPAQMDRELDDFDPCVGKTANQPSIERCMARDLAAIATCDVVAVLDGWANSSGSRIELGVAVAMNKQIISARSGSEVTAGVREVLRCAPRKIDDGNPKDAVARTKPPLELIPPSALIHEAMAFRDGAIVKEYGPYNWRKTKVKAMVYLGAALRHICDLIDGEDFASDSGVHHAGHGRACLGIFLDAQENGNLIDDRPPKGNAPKLIERLTAKKV